METLFLHRLFQKPPVFLIVFSRESLTRHAARKILDLRASRPVHPDALSIDQLKHKIKIDSFWIHYKCRNICMHRRQQHFNEWLSWKCSEITPSRHSWGNLKQIIAFSGSWLPVVARNISVSCLLANTKHIATFLHFAVGFLAMCFGQLRPILLFCLVC